MNMKNSPIIMFVYNRADHFERTYNALSKCAGAQESELYIFSDGPKNENSSKAVEKVRQRLREIENDNSFRSITIIESEKNKGLAQSIIYGVDEVIKKHGRAIVIEDDCEASEYFLSYMNDCLDKFENDKRIGAVSGFTPSLAYPCDYGADIFTSYRSCSCSWATWRDRFENVDWKLEDIKSFYNNKELIKRFNSSGSDRFMRLYRQTKSNGTSWSVRFGLHLVKNGMLTVYPRYSYIQNIGCDETGVHSKSADAEKMRVDLSKAIKSPNISFCAPDKRIEGLMKKHYSGGLISDIKRYIAIKYIVFKEK